MAQQSWDKAGGNQTVGCSLAKARFAQKGRANFLDGHPDAEPWGGEQRQGRSVVRTVGSLGQDLEQSLNRTCAPKDMCWR